MASRLAVEPARARFSASIRALFLPLGLLFLVGSCRLGGAEMSSSSPDRTLTVFAAASLAEAMGELAIRFMEQNPGVMVALNLAGSQQLAQQLVQGAPADVFASADLRHMQSVVEAGRVTTADVHVLAHNRLVLVYPAANPAGLLTLSDLQCPGVRLVMAAPEVPAGRYALQFLEKAAQDPDLGAAFYDRIMENTVSYEENVRAVLSKVVLGEADAGFVYASDVVGLGEETVAVLPLPDSLNPVAEYPIAPLPDSADYLLAEAFIALALGPEGQAVLAKFGFQSP